jgi:hypothetical protein
MDSGLQRGGLLLSPPRRRVMAPRRQRQCPPSCHCKPPPSSDRPLLILWRRGQLEIILLAINQVPDNLFLLLM